MKVDGRVAGRRAVNERVSEKSRRRFDKPYIGEVGSIGVSLEQDVRVGEISVLQVGRKVPEASVVSLANESDPPNELLGSFGSWWDA